MPTAGTAQPVRVLLVGLPGMLHSIIRETLAQQPDMHVVDRDDRHDDTHESPDDPRADVILAPIAVRHPLEEARQATTARSEPTLIGITPDGRHVVVFHRDLSPEDLVHTIRAAAAEGGSTTPRTSPGGAGPGVDLQPEGVPS